MTILIRMYNFNHNFKLKNKKSKIEGAWNSTLPMELDSYYCRFTEAEKSGIKARRTCNGSRAVVMLVTATRFPQRGVLRCVSSLAMPVVSKVIYEEDFVGLSVRAAKCPVRVLAEQHGG